MGFITYRFLTGIIMTAIYLAVMSGFAPREISAQENLHDPLGSGFSRLRHNRSPPVVRPSGRFHYFFFNSAIDQVRYPPERFRTFWKPFCFRIRAAR